MFSNYFKKIKEYLSANSVTIVILLISIIISSICVVIIPIILGNITNEIFFNENLDSLKRLFLIVIALYIVNVLLQQYANYLTFTTVNNIINNIKIRAFTAIEDSEESYFRNTSTKELLYFFTKDIEKLRNILMNNSSSFIKSILVLIGVCISMFIYNTKLAMSVLFLSPFIIIIILYLERKSNIIRKEEADCTVISDDYVENILLNIKSIKANDREKETRLNFHNINIKTNRLIRQSRYISSVIKSILLGLNIFVISIVLISCSSLIIKNEIYIGTLFMFLLYIPLIYNSIFSIIKSYFELIYNNSLLNNLIATIEIPKSLKNEGGTKEVDSLLGNIIFNNVSFNIKDNAIKNLNLNIKMGNKIILLGSESSCKEYILDILEAGNTDYTGDILINNISYKDIKVSSIKNRIGKLTRNPIIFSGTILDNLIYGNKSIAKEDVGLVCRQVKLYDSIIALPNGFDTEIAPGSIILNKGEFILLNIARLILKNPDIIILEKGNHNLESAMEGKIKAAIDLLSSNKTIIIVTDKANPNTTANNIFIVKNGEVVDEGDYNTLSSKPVHKDIFN